MGKRLFIALEVPQMYGEVLASLDPGVKGVRWLPADQLHLTLSFLGNVGGAEEELLKEALAGVQVASFFLPIKGIAAFGGAHPTTLWAGVGKGHPHLFALHKRIQDAVLRVGLHADLKPFRPHVTVGRAAGVSRAALLPFLRKHEETEIDLWKVTGFALFASVLSAEGSTYSVEMR